MIRWVRVVAALGTVALGAALYGWHGTATLNIVPAMGAGLAVLVAIAGWPGNRAWLVWPAAVAAVVSLAVTLSYDVPPGYQESRWTLVEQAAMLALVFAVVRWVRPRGAWLGGGLLCVVGAAAFLRYDVSQSVHDTAGGVALWGLLALVPATAAAYLRHQEDRRVRAVAEARREQRLDLAHDLHDFVAHDVSEIVAQAQAARFAATGDAQVLAVLERIEAAGLRALASMDRTVHMLHAGPAARVPQPGLADLHDLVGRFPGAELRLDPELRVPRELAATAFRVVSEALTNVRRHAPTASRVAVTVATDDTALRVTVTDDGTPGPPGSRHSGLGLPGLTERVQALGGTFTAGPFRRADSPNPTGRPHPRSHHEPSNQREPAGQGRSSAHDQPSNRDETSSDSGSSNRLESVGPGRISAQGEPLSQHETSKKGEPRSWDKASNSGEPPNDGASFSQGGNSNDREHGRTQLPGSRQQNSPDPGPDPAPGTGTGHARQPHNAGNPHPATSFARTGWQVAAILPWEGRPL
ncbi:ATP-binding protein [Longispora sp. NPDC051575]|uniref:sensor histidine kinase n=1 Tax=Longispora sp. NPDC051575 TaxID=3154943 RepID=UPI00341BE850